MRLEVVLRELAADERIEEQLRVVEVLRESIQTESGIFGESGAAMLQQRERSVRHAIRTRSSPPLSTSPRFELELRFECLALGRCQLEFGRRDNFARAFAFAEIADTVLARIAPILIELGRDSCGGTTSDPRSSSCTRPCRCA